jgi:hypothetical protein
MSYRAAGHRTVIKTIDTSRGAVAYAATCTRRERDHQISYLPVQRDDGQGFDILRIDRRWGR